MGLRSSTMNWHYEQSHLHIFSYLFYQMHKLEKRAISKHLEIELKWEINFSQKVGNGFKIILLDGPVVPELPMIKAISFIPSTSTGLQFNIHPINFVGIMCFSGKLTQSLLRIQFHQRDVRLLQSPPLFH